MKSIRIGNDINVALSLMRDDAPFLLDKETITLFLHTPFGKMELTDYSVEGNVISWVFFGKNQKAIGKYSLILVINKGKEGMITTDACDFVNLVSCSCKTEGADSCGVVTEYVNLVSKVDVGGSGGGAQEILKVEYGKTTFQEIKDAYVAGKYIVFEYANNVFHINRVTDTEIYFVSINGTLGYRVGLNNKNNWYQNVYANEQSTNKTTTISESSTDTQYPSAKAVYEALQNVGGGSDVFVAEYGVTTYNEILEAYNADKIVICKYNNVIFRLVYAVNIMHFAANVNKALMYVRCPQSNKWQQSTENTEHKLETLDNGNVQLTIAGQSAEVATPQYVENAIQQSGGGGASSDKQGVVSQTLNYNSADNTYSVSNVVRGSIPSFFIDLVTEAGASFNAESGYFSLNGIDNIAYDEMRQIYDCRTGYGTNSLLAVYGKTYTARTNFVAFRGYEISYSNHEPTTIYTKYLCGRNASITKFALCGDALYVKAGSGNNFESLGLGSAPLDRSRLEEIIGVLDVTNLTGSNNFFYTGAWHPWLTAFQLKALKASIDLSGMPRLSEATILYMINNEKAASAITIKLHADAKAMADASEAIQSALANHANITLGV